MSNKRVPSNHPDWNANNPTVAGFDSANGFEVDAADGAIGVKEGSVFITKGTAAALTLVAPTAGAPSAGGDDGKRLRVIATTAAAHTLTTPANKINGNKLTATFAAAVGNFIELVAYQGVWYQTSEAGITLT